MGILAHEVGPANTVNLVLYLRYGIVHHAMDICRRGHGTGSTLIVNGSWVEGTSCIVGVSEVYATVALVAKAPGYDA